ncbi:hypothetical protein DMV29_25705 [Salmonella enterica subsp. enterica serovar Typhimurium]|nr:hypothetical protein [Salmonella enterica subsp. enterica serovar Typhimurium]
MSWLGEQQIMPSSLISVMLIHLVILMTFTVELVHSKMTQHQEFNLLAMQVCNCLKPHKHLMMLRKVL